MEHASVAPERRRHLADFADGLGLTRHSRPFASMRFASRHATTEGSLHVHLDDLSALPLLGGLVGIELYQHRARMRAGDGDIVLTATEGQLAFEQYCREALGFGAPEYIVAPPVAGPIAVARAAGRGTAYARLVERARTASHVVVHPYMAHEAVWELADKLARDRRGAVSVLGSAPPVTWLANDKHSFSQLVRLTLGDGALPELYVGATAGELAELLCALAMRHERVALKCTRSVSSMGNAIFDAAALRERGRMALERDVAGFLAEARWRPGERVQAVAWEPVTSSPSTQVFVPPAGEGAPRLDGVFEQVLEGPKRIFVGSRPSQLPAALNARLRDQALALASALQTLGYVGRCAFDHLVVGELDEAPRLLLVDCNGRWGGTSTPMHIMDRLFPTGRPHYRAQDIVHPGLKGASFEEVRATLGDDVFDIRTGRGHLVFYNVEPLAASGKLDVIAFSTKSQVEAEEALLETLPRRLGL